MSQEQNGSPNGRFHASWDAALNPFRSAHIPKGWGHERQRIAGIALCMVLAVLIVSGYMLYYVGGEALRDWTGLIHWSIGIGLPAIFAWHYINGLRARRKPSR